MKTTLQTLRKAAGFRSAKAFAEHLGLNVATYTSYEQGRYNLTLEQAWAFADALGEALGRFVSLDELAGRDFPAGVSPPSDPREAEMLRVWGSLDPGRRDRLIETARDMEIAKRRGDSAVQEKVNGA